MRQHLVSVFPRLWRYCLVLTGNPTQADDLAQAVCLRAIEKADAYSDDGRFDRWIFRMTQRVWLNELRATAVRRGGGMATIDEIDLPDPRSDTETNILARQVLLKIMGLPEAQRATVVLVYVEGYRYKEAADILEVPIGTVMSRLAAARRTLNNNVAESESIVG
ncbi:MAG: RNA polymerase sigma factor [Pseudomonadota bacterium]